MVFIYPTKVPDLAYHQNILNKEHYWVSWSCPCNLTYYLVPAQMGSLFLQQVSFHLFNWADYNHYGNLYASWLFECWFVPIMKWTVFTLIPFFVFMTIFQESLLLVWLNYITIDTHCVCTQTSVQNHLICILSATLPSSISRIFMVINRTGFENIY